MAEGPVNLNWNPIMKHVNENPYEFFTTGGWGFLGASNGENHESEDDSGSESEYEQAPSESDYSEAGASESDFHDGSDASDDEGSGSDFSGSEGDDWDELERKAARCKCYLVHPGSAPVTSLAADKKTQEGKKVKGNDSDDSDARPKKAPPKGKAAAKPPAKANGKVSGKAKANGKR